MGAADDTLVGRRAEHEALVDFVCGESGVRTLLLEGEAGIGKTVLWSSAVEAGRAGGATVLASRPAEAEARFAFAVLTDLLACVDGAVVAELPPPLRHTVEVALLMSEADAPDVLEPRAVATAFLSTLRLLSERGRVIVAIDDVQWVDEASAAAIGFALRRLDQIDVSFLFAHRSATQLPEGVPLLDQLERIELGPLSLGATRRLLATVSHQPPSRQVAARIHEAAGGNPFFALELARALDDTGGRIGSARDLPVPNTLDELIGKRLEALPEDAAAVVLATSLAFSPTARLLTAAGSARGLDAAEAAGVLVREGESVRLAHPLIGAVARARATTAARRAARRSLAKLVTDPEERVLHEAASVDPPDERIATALTEAASAARARGSNRTAAELSEASWGFTSLDAPERTGRLFSAVEDLIRIGADAHGRGLLQGEVSKLPAGATRGWALHLLAMMSLDEADWDEIVERALVELATEPRMRAAALAEAANHVAVGKVSDVARAYAMASEACELARSVGDEPLVRRCLTQLAWPAGMLGLPEAAELQSTGCDAPLWDDADRTRALWHMWRGETAAARLLLDRLRRRAEEAEEDRAVCTYTLHLFELDYRVGDEPALARRASELETVAAGISYAAAAVERCVAAGAALRGDRAAAEAAAARVHAKPGTSRWHQLETQRSCGVAALGAGDHTDAVALLRTVVDETRAAGIRNPGVFPAAPGLIEGLVGVGRLDEAGRELELLEAAAHEQSHPWAAAAAAHGRGQLLVARGDAAGALVTLAEAVSAFRRLELPLDEARALLALGRAQRAAGARRDARDSLERAAVELDRLGAAGFAAQGRAELGRISGRRRSEGLTQAEEQVARLAAEGLTNRQIAEALVLAVRTVESHLTRVYGKLGVRSRTELARHAAVR